MNLNISILIGLILVAILIFIALKQFKKQQNIKEEKEKNKIAGKLAKKTILSPQELFKNQDAALNTVKKEEELNNTQSPFKWTKSDSYKHDSRSVDKTTIPDEQMTIPADKSTIDLEREKRVAKPNIHITTQQFNLNAMGDALNNNMENPTAPLSNKTGSIRPKTDEEIELMEKLKALGKSQTSVPASSNNNEGQKKNNITSENIEKTQNLKVLIPPSTSKRDDKTFQLPAYNQDQHTQPNLANIEKNKEDASDSSKTQPINQYLVVAKKDEDLDQKYQVLEKQIKGDDQTTQVINNNKKIKPQVSLKVLPYILVVDDSYVVRKKIGDLLTKNEYEIKTFNDGWEAFTYLNDANSRAPEILITDIEMPNMDGIKLIESVREIEKYKNLPILVVSAHVELHFTLMSQGDIQGFISKPFKDNELLSQIDYLLNI